jgi:hypothetical protein
MSPSRWRLGSAAACSTTSLRSPTPGSDAAGDGRWAVLAVAVAAVLSGARSLAAIGEWGS